jgi:endonuclease YncB( thermonuclease family)
MRHAPRSRGGRRHPAACRRPYWRGRAAPRLKPSLIRIFAFATLVGVILTSRLLVGDDGFLFGVRSASASETIVGPASVIDGDTLEIHGQRIRLHGIDAPETEQTCKDDRGGKYRCGQRSALALSNKIGKQPVTCEPRGTDRYQRLVAICRAGGEDLGAWSASGGWAIAFRRYSPDYVRQEDAAREAKRGLWAGTFMAPEEWRQGKDSSGLSTASSQKSGCLIKGNISSKGERIYHLPGGEFYGQTHIDPPKGERMFCTEAEAKAAGWRRSKR